MITKNTKKMNKNVVSEVERPNSVPSVLIHIVIFHFVISFVFFFKVIIDTYIPFVHAGVIRTTTELCARYSSLVTTTYQGFAL